MANKRCQINVRVSEEDMKLIESVAQENRMSKSDVVRLAMRGELKKVTDGRNKSLSNEEREQALKTLGRLTEEMVAVRHDNARMGSNVNQIAKSLALMSTPKPDIPVDEYQLYGMRIGRALNNMKGDLHLLWQSLK